jgi:hypothetical protein
MFATIWLVVIAVLLVVAWRRFGLGAAPFGRVVLVALAAGVALTAGLYLSWWLQPPTNPAKWLVMLSDVALLFPLVAVVGINRMIDWLAPVLMALEVSLLLVLIMGAIRLAGRSLRAIDRHQ